MGIGLYLKERIAIRSILHLEIADPGKGRPINATGFLVWVEKFLGNPGFDFIAGMTLTEIDPEDKRILVDYAYNHRYGHLGNCEKELDKETLSRFYNREEKPLRAIAEIVRRQKGEES